MIGLLQRVTHAKVQVADATVGQIERGLMVLVGVEKNDDTKCAKRLLERLLNYRVFPDETGRMNLSVQNIHGGLLLVPQFTLSADTRKGNRPSFSSAADPAMAETLFGEFCALAKQTYENVAFGQFGADMQVSLTNDGPVTFWLQTSNNNAAGA